MPRATLAGVTLDVTGDVRWRLVTGVRPHVGRFIVTSGIARAIAVAAPPDQDVTLQIGEKTFQGLQLLAILPGPRPWLSTLEIADRRWRWPSLHVYRPGYNVRRHTGDKRLLGTDVRTDLIVDEIEYNTATIRDGRVRWTADEALRDVLAEAGRELGDTVDVGILPSRVAFEDLVLDIPLPAALESILRFLPGADVYPRENGTFRVASALDRSERATLATLGPPVIGGGIVRVVDNERTRPRLVNVLFTPEIEVAFDADATATITRFGPDRLLQNVLPLPDPTLAVAGTDHAAGSWVALDDDLYTAWGTPAAGVPPLTDALVRRGLVLAAIPRGRPYWDQWLRPGEITLDRADWASRIGAVMTHYRVTWRFPQAWLDRFLTWRAHRTAIINPVTASRAPSPVYADYCVFWGIRGMARERDNASLGKNFASFDAATASARRAPAMIRILDADVGVLGIEWRLDPYGFETKILPGTCPTLPTADPEGRVRHAHHPDVTLAAEYRLRTILTAVPRAPGLNGLHREVVTPLDAERLLGADLGRCSGPPLDIRVPAGLLTARWPWRDEDETAIEDAFGIVPGRGGVLALDPARMLDGRAVRAVAEAIAAEAYIRYRDRPLGSRTDEQRAIEPTGAITAVEDTVTTRGAILTTVELRQEPPPLDFRSLLPADVRRLVFREVQQ